MLASSTDGGAPGGRVRFERRPALCAVARRTVPRLVEAMVIPAALLYFCVLFLDIEVTMLIVLGWTYGALACRGVRRERISGLLVLAAVGLTVRTLVALFSGITVVYFLQPIGATVLVAALLLGSVAVRRPLVARLAADFCPLAPDVATRPGVVRLFRNLTVLWAMVQLVKALTTLAMLVVLPIPSFVASMTVSSLLLTTVGIVLTIAWSLRTAHREGLVFTMVTAPAG